MEGTGIYQITLFSEFKSPTCGFEFKGRLFQAGTNQFFDLLPKQRACDDSPGAPPGIVGILQAVTLQPMHMVVKVQPTTNGLNYAFVNEEGLRYAQQRYPELFIDGELPRMRPNTRNQKEFLLKMGSDTNVFSSVSLKRRKET